MHSSLSKQDLINACSVAYMGKVKFSLSPNQTTSTLDKQVDLLNRINSHAAFPFACWTGKK